MLHHQGSDIYHLCCILLARSKSRQCPSSTGYETQEAGILVVQSLSHVWLFATQWTAAHQTSLSFTVSWSLLRFVSIESVMLSNHLILCCPLLQHGVFWVVLLVIITEYDYKVSRLVSTNDNQPQLFYGHLLQLLFHSGVCNHCVGNTMKCILCYLVKLWTRSCY